MMSCLKQAVNLLSPLWSCKAISLNKEWAIAHINSSDKFARFYGISEQFT